MRMGEDSSQEVSRDRPAPVLVLLYHTASSLAQVSAGGGLQRACTRPTALLPLGLMTQDLGILTCSR